MADAQEFSVAGRRVLVVGAGQSGVAAAKLLASRGAEVTVTDRRSAIDAGESLRAQGVALQLGGHAPEAFSAADLVVVSPGVPLDQPAIQSARSAGTPVIGELELASRWLRGKVIAVTGTKGKSTTSTLIGRMLEASGMRAPVGGNIGVPLSAQVNGSTPDTVHVIEASSFQLEATDTFHPWIAAVLNFSPDHLDHHPSLEAYAAAKTRIFRNQTAADWAVVNADDEPAMALARGTRAAQVAFGLSGIEAGYTVAGDAIVHRHAGDERRLVPLEAVHVLGRHLLSDIVAAVAVSDLAGATAEGMTAAVNGFGGLEHAMERVAQVEGVWFINDSKATNVESARRSIESVSGDLVVIMGGRYKGGDFASLAAPLAGRTRAVLAIGEAAGLIAGALGRSVRVDVKESLEEAVRTAFELASGGATVVLAPACSSFPVFRDYAERGRVFKAEVQRLADMRRATREQ